MKKLCFGQKEIFTPIALQSGASISMLIIFVLHPAYKNDHNNHKHTYASTIV
jgi:hypothetical protein